MDAFTDTDQECAQALKGQHCHDQQNMESD